MSRAKKILKDLIRIDSNKYNSNIKIIDYIENIFSKFETNRYVVDKKRGLYNLIIKIEGKNNDENLIFVLHTDTVPPGKEWNTNPFEPVENNNRIYGLGACDIKGSIATIIDSVISMESKPKSNVYLIFDCDEEGTMAGARDLIERMNFDKASIIICEPTNNKIMIGHKGALGITIETRGKELHSANTDYQYNLENNAILKMSKIIERLTELDRDIISKRKEKGFGSSTMNIGVVNGGTTTNSVPGRCLLKIDRRLLPLEDIATAFKEIIDIVLDVYSDAIVQKTFSANSYLLNKNSLSLKKIKTILKPANLELGIFSALSEAYLFSKWGDCIILGPGDIKNAHKSNEYIEIEEVEKYSKIFKKIISNF